MAGRLLFVLSVATLVGAMLLPRANPLQTGTAQAAVACPASLPAPTGGSGRPLVASANTFSFALFRRVFAGRHTTNTFLSPFSVALALEMVYGGAEGATRTSMARTLDLGGMSAATVERDAATLIRVESKDTAKPVAVVPGAPVAPTQLRLANSVWADQHVHFNPAFLAAMQRYFDARVGTLDFSSPAAAPTINAWVTCATNGKIPKIVNSLQGIIMALLNAVYFQGSWSKPFDRANTHPQQFTTGTGHTIRTPMMHQGAFYTYYTGPDYQVLNLPYGSDGRFGMVIVLPRTGESLAQFAPRLTLANFGFWMSKMHRGQEQNGEIAMPRLQVRYAQDLKAPLKALGMAPAFAPSANFSGLCPNACTISHVLHRTFLHVDEKGTTAAAVTAVMIMAGGGAPPPPPFHMVIDHPFFLAIRDSHTGALLFLGAINHP